MAPLLLDLTHTSHTRARTGIQRVTRSLHAALGNGALAITHDPHAQTWRPLEAWEQINFIAETPTEKRGAHWPWPAKLRGRMRRLLRGASERGDARAAPKNKTDASLKNSSGVLVPEIFSPTVAGALPDLFAASSGPRVAIFHDAIALKFPELTPTKSVARFPAYLIELLAFDGVAAVSEDSRASLVDYWRWLEVKKSPPVQAIPLGVDLPSTPLAAASQSRPLAEPPVVLCVGSIEGRKNHLALLEACEALWKEKLSFTLHLIGLAQAQTGAAALERIRSLQATGHALRYDGPVSEAALEAAYRECAFTVYPSLIEGFGLPVLESLAHGKACICSARGALGESARGGGCRMLDDVAAPSLATAMRALLENSGELTALSAAARTRAFKTWPQYAAELTGWMRTLRRRD